MDKFFKLIIHRDHLLLIDYLLNNVLHTTNMPYSLRLADELKKAVSSALGNVPIIYPVKDPAQNEEI